MGVKSLYAQSTLSPELISIKRLLRLQELATFQSRLWTRLRQLIIVRIKVSQPGPAQPSPPNHAASHAVVSCHFFYDLCFLCTDFLPLSSSKPLGNITESDELDIRSRLHPCPGGRRGVRPLVFSLAYDAGKRSYALDHSMVASRLGDGLPFCMSGIGSGWVARDEEGRVVPHKMGTS